MNKIGLDSSKLSIPSVACQSQQKRDHDTFVSCVQVREYSLEAIGI